MTQVVITGANRGVGLALTRAYLEAGADVAACCRQPEKARELLKLLQTCPELEVFELDVTDFDAIDALGEALSGRPIHLLINNAGIYGPNGVCLGHTPENDWQQLFRVNVMAPLKMVETLLDGLKLGQGVIANISSKVGSMGDNRSGGGYLYRSSKAAQNAVTRSLAVDLGSFGIKAVALHPGWVKTAMGGPNALIDPETAAAGLMNVINLLTEQHSGGFFDYQGNSIPW